ncbi:MAG: MFS transporter [Deltaproteobacteria bacterium]|nr:MAG: MFS transporter [Deltaproteobacteria bacterium]
MLRRFCLYGFLKNQQYFEPYLVLAFLQKGLSFFQIGMLVACREATVNLLEVPSGAVADIWGRRRSMMLSFVAYMASFVLLALAGNLLLLVPAMVLFGVGETFRTGTHKALILSWLKEQGLEREKTRVYGLTRSWSKLGSAAAVVIGTGWVLYSDDYVALFWLSLLPYTAGLVNFLGYPRQLDQPTKTAGKSVAGHLWQSLRKVFTESMTRRLVLEGTAYEGAFRVTREYLQPLLQAAAVSMVAAVPAVGHISPGHRRQSALLVGPVYLFLYLLSAAASRRTGMLAKKAGSERAAARVVWTATLFCYAAMLPSLLTDLKPAAIACLVLAYVLQNFYRPLFVSRLWDFCPENMAATVLSVETQLRSFVVMLLAPAVGAAVDWATAIDPSSGLWPVSAAGIAAAVAYVLSFRKERQCQ